MGTHITKWQREARRNKTRTKIGIPRGPKNGKFLLISTYPAEGLIASLMRGRKSKKHRYYIPQQTRENRTNRTDAQSYVTWANNYRTYRARQLCWSTTRNDLQRRYATKSARHRARPTLTSSYRPTMRLGKYYQNPQRKTTTMLKYKKYITRDAVTQPNAARRTEQAQH